MFNISIKEFYKGLAEKKFSAKEATEFFIKQIKEKDEEVKAFLEVFEESALEEAKRVDEILEKRENFGVLTGVPMAVKDNILIKGKEATGGSKILKGHRAEYDATVIKKLKESKVVFLGRTNMDEFAMGSSTENSAWQVTHNPNDLERVPGGTSGGSAAAVAAEMAMAALGSDTGGSIRQPASFCGVVGLKPTYGAVSRFGLIAAASSFDQIGSLTKTAEDAAIIFSAIAGKDELDSTNSVSDFGGEFEKDDFERVKSFTLGIPKELLDKDGKFKGLDLETAVEIEKSKKRLEDLGIKFKEVSMPFIEYALPCYYIMIFAEESSNLARFDGLRYGASTKENKSLFDLYLENKSAGFGEEVKRRIILGTFVLSSGYYDAYYGKAEKVRRLIKKDFKNVFSSVDAIFMPTAPTVAYKIGEKIIDPLAMYMGDIFTVTASVAGLPAVSLPTEKKENRKKLPVGFQIIGKPFHEGEILKVGMAYEK